MPKKLRHLILVLGDQLNADSSAFDDFDKENDAVWMAEVASEAKHVWSHKARIALFLSAMRHFAEELRKDDKTVHYRKLDDKENQGSFGEELKSAVSKLKPEKLIVTEPGEYRVREELQETAEELQVPLEIRQDRHFLCSIEEFADYANDRKSLRMEYFYRMMRKRYDILLDDGEPTGGDWNYDSNNRKSFGKSGPGKIPEGKQFAPDKITKDVIALVNKQFADHPGELEHFSWPVTAKDANKALDDFLEHRLSKFGDYQDAMWTGEPFLYHSRISAALNLKLLDPRAVCAAAEKAYRDDKAPLPAVEGFIRQILGWREYIRGIYWYTMPDYLSHNALNADQPLPDFYWTGDTEMTCLRETIGQTLKYGYAHHIQRLMVTGLYALLLGVEPKQIHEWYLAVYVDAIEWVELPNVVGMSQFADGGMLASKPYAATGKYIKRMSNYCDQCRYNPDERTGDNACPFTTLYWDFLLRNEERLQDIGRMNLQLKNLDRLSKKEKDEIRKQAKQWKK